MIPAVGINTKQNSQKNNDICFGRLQGSRNAKRGFWVCFSEKSKKREKVLGGCKHWPWYSKKNTQ